MTTRFNSTLVRLKVEIDQSAVEANEGFNSTLVRLKAPTVQSARLRKPCFNSTLVRLKAPTVQSARLRKPCFNSTLVRLKESKRRADAAEKARFQFHTGSIKSVADSDDDPSNDNVSIPHWFD